MFVIWNPALAGRLVREDGPVEWLQVALAVAALVTVVGAPARRRSPSTVVLGALFAWLAVFEVDLDQRVFGIPVVDWRFFRRATVPWPVRGLVALIIAGAVAALLVYVVMRRRQLWTDVRDGWGEGWVAPLVVGLLLFGAPQPFESALNRLPGLPRYFAEETLELVGLTYVALAMAGRARSRPTTAAGSSG